MIDGRIRLVGLGEPESTLHPGAASALFDAISEASKRVQVVATSHSADLLDHNDLDSLAWSSGPWPWKKARRS